MNTLLKYCKISVIASIIVMIAIPVRASETVRFVYFDLFEPFSWKEDEQMHGIFIDVVNEVFTNRLGIAAEHRGYPWKRAQQMVRDGEADGMCTISTPERLSYNHPTEYPVIEVNFKIFTRADHPKLDQLKAVRSLSELQGFRLVDILGSGWAKQHLKGMDVSSIATYDQMFQFLVLGRADATIRNNRQTRYLLKKFGFQEQIIELPQPMMPEPQSYRILIGKQSPFVTYLPQLNEMLKQIQEDGTLQRIYDKYQ